MNSFKVMSLRQFQNDGCNLKNDGIIQIVVNEFDNRSEKRAFVIMPSLRIVIILSIYDA